MANLADEIERTGNENGVPRAGFGEDALDSFFRIGHDGESLGVMRRDFGKLGGGDCAGGARLGENDFGSARKEQACNLVHGFFAQRAVNQPDFAIGKVLRPEGGQFARCGGVVRAVEIDVGLRMDFFEAAGPFGGGDALADGFIRNAEAVRGENPGSGGSG